MHPWTKTRLKIALDQWQRQSRAPEHFKRRRRRHILAGHAFIARMLAGDTHGESAAALLEMAGWTTAWRMLCEGPKDLPPRGDGGLEAHRARPVELMLAFEQAQRSFLEVSAQRGVFTITDADTGRLCVVHHEQVVWQPQNNADACLRAHLAHRGQASVVLLGYQHDAPLGPWIAFRRGRPGLSGFGATKKGALEDFYRRTRMRRCVVMDAQSG